MKVGLVFLQEMGKVLQKKVLSRFVDFNKFLKQLGYLERFRLLMEHTSF